MPGFPPVFDGRAVAGDPYEAAVAAAREGCQGGLLLYRPTQAQIDAALVLAPDVPLAAAAAMFLVAANGFADAFGALAPPETALHFDWPAAFRIEGARCGGIRAAAPKGPVDRVPGWLVLHLNVPVDRGAGAEPGERPDETDLTTEGVDVAPDDLLSAWTRHTLSWIARWEEDGLGPVHRDWTGRAAGIGRAARVETPDGLREGTLMGLDEDGSLLLKGESGAILVPLTAMLERRC